MSKPVYSIDNAIFEMFPGYCRGVVLAFDIKIADSPPDLVSMLREAEKALHNKINSDDPASHPRINSWREAYRLFGAKPAKFRSSIEGMVRRVLNGNELPTINTVVDIGNILSLRHIITAGAHAIDVVKGDISLRRATGEESFTPFGTDITEQTEPGEIIFTEGNNCLTRRWSWRQAEHTSMKSSTTAFEMNIDGLPPVTRDETERICIEAVDLIKRFCGGRVGYKILDTDNPKMELKL
jgi:DNA/RNA-binding domain of Phe-tRNA-synthetase-like protein